MARNKNIPPPAMFVDPSTGLLTRQANNFLNSITASSNEAAAGEILTPPDGGLEGGGSVADGLTLSIAPNGVENSMIRQSLGTSVIGRFQNSTGDVADIQAGADNRILGRFGGQLVFQPLSLIPSTVADGDYGDVTVSGVGTVWTIDNTVVTYAKMQNVSAASRLLGRGSAAGAGSPEEVTLGSGLTLTGTVLSASGSGGTVTSVSVVTANGISGSVATSTTTPAITLTLGAITPSSVAAVGTVTGSNLSGTNTGDQTITLTGDVTGTGTGSFATAIGAGVIVNADVNASAGIVLSKLAAMTASRAVVSDGSGFLVPATTTATEIGFVNGVTSAIQTQLNAKAALVSPSTDNAVVRFDGTAGLQQNSGVLLNDMGGTWSAGITTIVDVTESAASTNASSRVGITASITGTGSGTTANIFPLNFTGLWAGTTTLTSLVGCNGAVTASGTGQISIAAGFRSRCLSTNTGGIALAADFFARSPAASAGTIVAAYGLYIQAHKVSGVTTGYGVYQFGSTDLNVFEGSVRIGGSTAPTNALSVTGSVDVSVAVTAPSFVGNASSATILATGRTIGITGDATWTSPSFNGSANVTAALTLATVNANVGAFGSATQVATFTVNAKGLTTAAANVTITPAVGSITGLGTGVATALGVNIGSAGAVVAFNGAGGTPSSLTLTNATGLPISTGVAGLATGIATFLATPNSANLATAVTDETGSGALVFANTPTLVTPDIGAATGTSLVTTGAVTAKGDVNIWGGNAQLAGGITASGAGGGLYIYAAGTGALPDQNIRLVPSGTGVVQAQGLLSGTASIEAATYFKNPPKTVVGLTAAATAGAGARDFVSDALAPAFGAAVVGGGAVSVPVYSDGAVWNVG